MSLRNAVLLFRETVRRAQQTAQQETVTSCCDCTKQQQQGSEGELVALGDIGCRHIGEGFDGGNGEIMVDDSAAARGNRGGGDVGATIRLPVGQSSIRGSQRRINFY